MEQAGRFDALSPASGIVAGTAALGGAAVTEWVRRSTLDGDERAVAYVAVWGAVYLVSFAATVILTGMKLHHAGRNLWSPLIRMVALSVGPAFLAGSILTLYLMHTWQLALIPCAWMITYGAGACAAALFSYRVFYLWGLLFIAAGAVSFFLEPVFRQLMMAGTFGLLHWVYALAVWAIHRHEARAVGRGELSEADYERLFRDPGGA